MITERPVQNLTGVTVFLSASIPDPDRWQGYFDPLEITDAVVAIARSLLGAGARIVTAAHPTIAPLLLYVAAELPPADEPQVIVYQSMVFEPIMPEATLRFEAAGIGTLIRTARVDNEPPEPSKATQSLRLMRHQMLSDAAPSAAIFIGGMKGIPDEQALFDELHNGAPTYAIGYPGGEARRLAESSTSRLRQILLEGTIYPVIGRAIVADMIREFNG